jgi:hypothetical protein
MAKVQPRKRPVRKAGFMQDAELPERTNLLIILAGIVTIIIGYLVMQAGDDISPLSVTYAPIILVIGYCVIVPIGIFWRKKQQQQ